MERFADSLCHRAHRLGKRRGDAANPLFRLVKRHFAGLVERNPAQQRRTGAFGEACSAAVGADTFFQEPCDALHAFLVLHVLQRVLDRVYGVEEGEVHLAGTAVLLDLIHHVVLLRRRVKDDVSLALGEIAPRHVRANSKMVAGDVLHERPHERLPRGDSPFVDGERIVWDDRRHVHLADDARAVASLARPLRVERQLLRARGVESLAAFGADELALRRHVQGRREVMPVRTSMRREARVHEPQRVQQLRRRAEGGADARHSGTLPQGERGGNVANVLDVRPLRLRHAATRVSRERFKVSPRTLGIDHAQCKRGLSASGNARHADDLSERNVYVDVLEVVLSRSAHLNRGRLCPAHLHSPICH